MVAIEADLIRTLGAVVEVFDATGVRYALIGGVAKAAWGRSRATRDIDVALSIDLVRLEHLKRQLANAHFVVVDSVGGDASDLRPDIFVARDPGGVPVDVLVAKTPFEEDAVTRSVTVKLLGHTLRVVTAEDLVFYKLLAGRPRDRDDILDVVKTQLSAEKSFDWNHLERLAAEWDVEAALKDVRRSVGLEA